ncbi:SDR family oxidoreductase [Yinghuangia sp. YIM S09857]|uniref:SDR family oxidoreductase n=1 Tax=Yinghuangia sp. YIM S09857 TaxID=3436929 RepID=UPI003F532988
MPEGRTLKGKTLEGKTAVVTGGSRGIGRGIVERLCRDGAHVLFNYASSHAAAEDVVRQVGDDGGKVRAMQFDLTEPDAAERLMREAEAELGGLDILVNNAATAFVPTPLADVEPDLFDRVMATDMRSVFVMLQYAARRMRDGGRIVTVSTLNTVHAAPGIAPYAASKGAIEQLTYVAARELGVRGITANVVSPGATDTDLLRGTNPPEALEMAAAMSPLGRLGEPSDVADVVAFLVGPDARWLTGQNVRATGGIT